MNHILDPVLSNRLKEAIATIQNFLFSQKYADERWEKTECTGTEFLNHFYIESNFYQSDFPLLT